VTSSPSVAASLGEGRTVALYGGSFNPPHAAHQLLALYVLETQPVDELWFVPTFVHAFDKQLAAFEDRLAMCERTAAALGPRVSVCPVERDLGGKSRTLLTVRRLQSEHPGWRFAVVIGADLVREVDGWYGAEELRRLVSFIVVGRQGAEVPSAHGRAPLSMPEVSSTRIRAALAAGEDVRGLVPKAVLDYVYERGLYDSRLPRPHEAP
jgi:nicotinate-nucleotide adenylyltransferase